MFFFFTLLIGLMSQLILFKKFTVYVFGVQNEEEEFQIPVTIKSSFFTSYQSTKKLAHLIEETHFHSGLTLYQQGGNISH